jgi:hypothetical protein
LLNSPDTTNYLRFTFGLTRHEYMDFHCHGQEFNVGGRRHEPNPSLQGWRASTDKCPGLAGTGFGIEAATDKRRLVYLDGVVISASEESPEAGPDNTAPRGAVSVPVDLRRNRSVDIAGAD